MLALPRTIIINKLMLSKIWNETDLFIYSRKVAIPVAIYRFSSCFLLVFNWICTFHLSQMGTWRSLHSIECQAQFLMYCANTFFRVNGKLYIQHRMEEQRRSMVKPLPWWWWWWPWPSHSRGQIEPNWKLQLIRLQYSITLLICFVVCACVCKIRRLCVCVCVCVCVCEVNIIAWWWSWRYDLLSHCRCSIGGLTNAKRFLPISIYYKNCAFQRLNHLFHLYKLATNQSNQKKEPIDCVCVCVKMCSCVCFERS